VQWYVHDKGVLWPFILRVALSSRRYKEELIVSVTLIVAVSAEKWDVNKVFPRSCAGTVAIAVPRCESNKRFRVDQTYTD
jgi:hypothetical protein